MRSGKAEDVLKIQQKAKIWKCPIRPGIAGLAIQNCRSLFLQGKKDPMQNAQGRAKQMRKLCSNVEVVLVDAGHCPFDESPEFCNKELLSFVESLSRIPAAPASTEGSTALAGILS